MEYSVFALTKLKEAGYKITEPRKVVVKLLAQSEKALTPYEMKEILKADVVTIYRVLETLESLSLVHKVLSFNGYIACHTDEAEEVCHHYLVCRNCHRVAEFEGEDLEILEKKVAQENKFKIESHYLEFIGLCEECKK